MNATEPALDVRQLTKRFDAAAGSLPVLSGADLALQQGQAVAITGPSGSGKSTLLYIIGLLDPPTSGTVRMFDQDVLALDSAAQADYRNRHLGFVFQDHHLLPQCTVLENVLLPTIAGDGAGREADSRAWRLLDRVELAARLDHFPAQLSGGERQRVAVCRALINQPQLVLADEPTGNLDRKSAEAVGSLLLEISREQKVMLICVTHSLELAGRFPTRYELQDGRLISTHESGETGTERHPA